MGLLEDTLSSAAIKKNLETRFIGQNIIYYPEVSSTMEIARREVRKGATEGTTVITETQTAGMGRIRRVWLSPEGNIALSVILYPGLPSLSSLIMIASLAVVHSIKAVTGLECRIKWPNDILINNRKVCGILIESEVRGGKVDYAILGIGLNVNLRLSDFPEIMSTATSLSHELGRNISRLDIIRQLLVEMEKLYLSLQDGGAVYEEWRNNLATLGRRIQVISGETVYEGIAEAVTRDGSLMLRQSGGSLTKITAGDVRLSDQI